MPSYAHLAATSVDLAGAAGKVRAMRAVGVPYTPDQIAAAEGDARAQAAELVADLAAQGVTARADSELVALTAYLQRLGRAATPPPPSPRPGGMPVTLAEPPRAK
jgi:cytochrome c oxidase cbb3-type subunit I/II